MSKESQISNLRGLWTRIKTKMTAADNALSARITALETTVPNLNTLTQEVVNELPAQGVEKKLYFVPSPKSNGTDNIYDEYIWSPTKNNGAGGFEQVGSTAYTPTHDAAYNAASDKVAISINGTTYLVPYIAAPATPVLKHDNDTMADNADVHGTQSFTLHCDTAGAIIRYTTDGTDVTTSSQQYSSAFSLAQDNSQEYKTYTVKAIAYVNGVASSQMTIHIKVYRVVAKPLFSPQAGSSYASVQNVAITCATTGAAIYYTLNGDDPTANSTLYESPIEVSGQKIIRAIAILSGWVSNTADATYQFQVSTPEYTTTGDQYDTTRSITVTKPANATSIKYRKNVTGEDFTTPTLDGNGKFTISNITTTTTYEIVAERNGWSSGSISPQIKVGTLYTHAGFSAAESASGVNMSDLTIVKKADTPNGEYAFSNTGSTSKYIWIFVPSGQTIHHALNNAGQDQLATGFNAPTDYNGYKCYRAKSKTAAGGTQTLTID